MTLAELCGHHRERFDLEESQRMVISGLGKSFDAWVSLRLKLAQWDLHQKIDANFDFRRRWMLWEETGIWMFSGKPGSR